MLAIFSSSTVGENYVHILMALGFAALTPSNLSLCNSAHPLLDPQRMPCVFNENGPDYVSYWTLTAVLPGPKQDPWAWGMRRVGAYI